MDFFIFLAKLCIPHYYLEVIVTGGVACLVAVVMNGWGGLQVLFVSFTKGPRGSYLLAVSRMLSKPVRLHISAEFPVPFQTW